MQGRRARRAEFEGEVTVLRGEQELRARASDISSKGMLISTQGPLWDRARVTVVFQLPDKGGPIKLEGAVVPRRGTNGQTAGWGIEFRLVPKPIKERLEAYVGARTQGPPPIPLRASADRDSATAADSLDDDQAPTAVIGDGALKRLRRNSSQVADPPTEGGVVRWW